MNNEDYVSYELAKKLKECGFDEPCNFYYTKEDAPDGAVWFTGDPRDPQDYNHLQDDCPFAKPICSAPHIYHAQKWLREKQKIDVLVWNCACGYGWEISNADPQSRGTTLNFYDDNGEDRDSGMWLTYENALSAGINVALQLLDNQKE